MARAWVGLGWVGCVLFFFSFYSFGAVAELCFLCASFLPCRVFVWLAAVLAADSKPSSRPAIGMAVLGLLGRVAGLALIAGWLAGG